MPKLRRLPHLLLLVVIACTTSPEVNVPPFEIVTSEGTVRACDPESARMGAELLSALAPEVRKILVDTQSTLPYVWFLDQAIPMRERVAGCVRGRRILVAAGAEGEESFVLTHELVHWQASGVWQTLPRIAQEGLADTIACQLNDEARFDRESWRQLSLSQGSLSSALAALNLDEEEWHSLDPVSREQGYGIAYFVVARIGVEPLRTICARAQTEGLETIPGEWLLEAANLPADLSQWRILVKIP